MIKLENDEPVLIMTQAELTKLRAASYKEGQIDMREICEQENITREDEARMSEFNSTLSILRGMGVTFDGRKAWDVRKLWKARAAAEKERKEQESCGCA